MKEDLTTLSETVINDQACIRITIHEDSKCKFWIALFQKGKLGVSELLTHQSLGDIFSEAVQIGLNEKDNFMFVDSKLRPSRYIYFSHLFSPMNLASKNEWIDQIKQVVRSWSPEHIGLYLAPQLFSKPKELYKLLDTLVTHLIISKLSVKHIYFWKGDIRYNSLLNITVNIKSHLYNSGHFITIYH